MIPASLKTNLRFPVIAAPMFLVSQPQLVIAACKSGVIGTFPALNQRSSEGYAQWLEEIKGALGPQDAAFGVNLIVHTSNARLEADLKVTVDHKVPLVITSLGAVREVVEAVHSYGGVVFHDIISRRHAEKAAEAGVDGLICVAAGAGGHAGNLSPFALLNEVRSVFDGTIILSGAISTGRDIASALMMGADMAYMGTRFIATEEAHAEPGYKQMLVDSAAKDIVYTDAISGINANFLIPSLLANGLDPKVLKERSVSTTKNAVKDPNHKINVAEELNPDAKAWKTIWSAGHGVSAIHEVLPAAALVNRLQAEFVQARSDFDSK